MTRWVFAALILTNIGLLMWASWYRGDSGSMPPRPLLNPELMVPITSPGVELKSRRSEKNVTPLVAARPKMRCIRVGSFVADGADAAANWLLAERVEHERRNEDVRVEGSYWIHVGPFDDRKQAEKRRQELEALGVRDLLIMQDSQGRIAISLGLFSQADNARARLQELATKGVAALQETRFRTESRTWYEVRVPEPADAAVARLRAHEWGAEVKIEDSACPAGPAPKESPGASG